MMSRVDDIDGVLFILELHVNWPLWPKLSSLSQSRSVQNLNKFWYAVFPGV